VSELKEKEGRPWNTVAKFEHFIHADARRQQLAASGDLQVKVHRCGVDGNDFAVKTRLTDSAHTLSQNHKRKRKK
jgi:hypothetical protein